MATLAQQIIPKRKLLLIASETMVLGTVLFLVEWDSVEAHAAGKDHEGFERFHRIAGPFFGGSGSMQHFRDNKA